MKDPYKILKYPLATEKAVKIMETENKLIFVVDKKATKSQIKQAIENEFKVKVLKVNTLVTPSAKKKAYISLSAETPAIDVATQLGLM
jgi:large subunit ribosomal protein L23